MNSTVRLAAAAILATFALRAQNVLVNEVRADDGGRWVEIHNRSMSAVDLSNWSLHLGTHTVGMPTEYWWPFPAGRVLPAGGYLRVHWFQQAPADHGADDLYTGTAPGNFLFWLGGEPLSAARGAFALFRSQNGDAMSSPQMIEDWVSWGDHGFTREIHAVTNGRWSAGRHAPAIPAGHSLARNGATIGAVEFHDQQWFVDATPTPLAINLAGASVTSHGTACAVAGHHLLGNPQLRAPELPIQGNANFRLEVDNTTGIYGEYVLVAWSAGAAPANQPSVLPPAPGLCAESIDTSQMIALWLLPAHIVTTTAPLSLATMPASLVGSEAHAQTFVLDLLPFAWSPFQGVSNALHVTFGS